jgi:hypothetical protein
MAQMGASADHVIDHGGAGSDAEGEAKASLKGEGEPGNKTTAKGEPGAEGLFDGMDAPTLHKSYKNIQREYSKVMNDVVKKFEAYGGAEQVLQWAAYLQNNPEFAQFVANQRNKTALGIDESKLDDSTREALSTVRKIAKAVAEEEVSKISPRIAEVSEAQKKELILTHMDTMDDKYGDDWHEMRELMSELSEGLPAKAQDNPTFDDFEDLYFKALRKSNKMEAYAAKQYESKLKTKQKQSTGKPQASGESAPSTAKSMMEAYLAAKEAQK